MGTFCCRLRDCGVKVKFVTNTTKEPMRTLSDRLTALGFQIEKPEIFTSLSAARQYVQEQQLRPLLYLEDCAKEDFHGMDTDLQYNTAHNHYPVLKPSFGPL